MELRETLIAKLEMREKMREIFRKKKEKSNFRLNKSRSVCDFNLTLLNDAPFIRIPCCQRNGFRMKQESQIIQSFVGERIKCKNAI